MKPNYNAYIPTCEDIARKMNDEPRYIQRRREVIGQWHGVLVHKPLSFMRLEERED